jgi:hypothetical protein
MSTVHPPTTGSHVTPHVGSHRAGHVVAVLVNLLVLYLVNVRPGWDAVPFLTAETTQVLPWVNASLWVTVVAESLYVAWDTGWFRALGDIVTTSVGLAALVKLWEVFPLDVTGTWEVLARVVLVLGVVGSLVGIGIALARLIRSLASSGGST